MDNLQMLKRKYIMRGWIDPRVSTKVDVVAWYKRLLSDAQRFDPRRLP